MLLFGSRQRCTGYQSCERKQSELFMPRVCDKCACLCGGIFTHSAVHLKCLDLWLTPVTPSNNFWDSCCRIFILFWLHNVLNENSLFCFVFSREWSSSGVKHVSMDWQEKIKRLLLIRSQNPKKSAFINDSKRLDSVLRLNKIWGYYNNSVQKRRCNVDEISFNLNVMGEGKRLRGQFCELTASSCSVSLLHAVRLHWPTWKWTKKLDEIEWNRLDDVFYVPCCKQETNLVLIFLQNEFGVS